MERKNAWNSYSADELSRVMALAEDYRNFISSCKTERECVAESIRIAEQAGYRPVAAVMVDGVGEVDLVLSQRPQAIVPGPAEGTHVLTAAAYPALLIETDGYTYHSSRPDWHSDHLRDQAALARGHTPLRLTSDQVLDRETVRIVSSVARRLGIHPDVTPGDF